MKRTITTTGSASVSAAPDSLRLRVSVSASRPSVSDALDAVASGVTALGEVAQTYVDRNDLASTGLSVHPAYDREGAQSGYQASHSLALRCRDLARAGELIPAVGALMDRATIDGMDLEIDDPAPLQVRARAAAYADARAKADELAALAGLTVVGALRIVEGGSEPVAPIRGVRMAMKTDAMPIEAGTQSISATLTVVWSVRELTGS